MTKESVAASSGEGNTSSSGSARSATLCLPKISSVQFRQRADTR